MSMDYGSPESEDRTAAHERQVRSAAEEHLRWREDDLSQVLPRPMGTKPLSKLDQLRAYEADYAALQAGDAAPMQARFNEYGLWQFLKYAVNMEKTRTGASRRQRYDTSLESDNSEVK